MSLKKASHIFTNDWWLFHHWLSKKGTRSQCQGPHKVSCFGSSMDFALGCTSHPQPRQMTLSKIFRKLFFEIYLRRNIRQGLFSAGLCKVNIWRENLEETRMILWKILSIIILRFFILNSYIMLYILMLNSYLMHCLLKYVGLVVVRHIVNVVLYWEKKL